MHDIGAITEHERLKADRAAMERGGATAPSTGTPAPDYVRGVHPDTGIEVTFVPGELLPDWAAAALAEGRSVYDYETRLWTILDDGQAAGTTARGGARRAAGQQGR